MLYDLIPTMGDEWLRSDATLFPHVARATALPRCICAGMINEGNREARDLAWFYTQLLAGTEGFRKQLPTCSREDFGGAGSLQGARSIPYPTGAAISSVHIASLLHRRLRSQHGLRVSLTLPRCPAGTRFPARVPR